MRISGLCGAVIAAAWLAACTQQAPPAGSGAATASPAPDTRVIPPRPGSEEAAGAPDAASPPPPTPRPEGLARAPAASRPSAGGTAEPRERRPAPELIGMSEAELRDAMGQPDHIRNEPPASVWRYNLTGCAIDLFLFEDVASGRTKALSYEIVINEGGGETPDKFCVEGKRLADG